jgi:hypothetical protein
VAGGHCLASTSHQGFGTRAGGAKESRCGGVCSYGSLNEEPRLQLAQGERSVKRGELRFQFRLHLVGGRLGHGAPSS